jgi:hypothetical protein
MLKIPNTKRAGGVAQGIGSEFKPQYHKKKKKEQIRNIYSLIQGVSFLVFIQTAICSLNVSLKTHMLKSRQKRTGKLEVSPSVVCSLCQASSGIFPRWSCWLLLLLQQSLSQSLGFFKYRCPPPNVSSMKSSAGQTPPSSSPQPFHFHRYGWRLSHSDPGSGLQLGLHRLGVVRLLAPIE